VRKLAVSAFAGDLDIPLPVERPTKMRPNTPGHVRQGVRSATVITEKVSALCLSKGALTTRISVNRISQFIHFLVPFHLSTSLCSLV
jgi:hypothetical protein